MVLTVSAIGTELLFEAEPLDNSVYSKVKLSGLMFGFGFVYWFLYVHVVNLFTCLRMLFTPNFLSSQVNFSSTI